VQTLAATRRYWLPQLIVLFLLALIGTLPFWFTDLDRHAAALFYHPEAEDAWLESRQRLWLFLYQIAPVLVALVAVGSLAVLAAGSIWPRWKRLRLPAIFLMATAILGPGLVLNAVLKDHWGRPRPHQTLEFGGTQAYLPPLMVGEAGRGKSFPSGHSSAGFLFGAFFLIWQRRRPRLALLALLGSILLGSLLGIARMSAGDHFLSDVIWSAVIVYGLAMLLYYLILRIPQREDADRSRAAQRHLEQRLNSTPRLRYPVATAAGYGIATTAMLSAILLATPVHDNRSRTIAPTEGQPHPRVLRLVADQALVSIAWHDWPDRSALILLKGRGFGLPGTRVSDRLETRDGILTYSIEHRGVFTEKDTSLIVGVVPSAWDRIEVETATGDIRIHSAHGTLPALDLKTGDGEVTRDVD
jgi:lipid A 4'-phosphatase